MLTHAPEDPRLCSSAQRYVGLRLPVSSHWLPVLDFQLL
jgi:hypothetical protein